MLLAIVWSLGYFRPYLLGSSTTIITDHKANHWVLEKTRPKCTISWRLTRWALLLQEYDYVVVYKPGRKYRNADALSRPPIVARKAKGQEFDFDPATWAAQDKEETEDLGTKVALVEAIDVIQTVPPEEILRIAPFWETSEEPHIPAFGDLFRFPNVSDAKMREEQLRDPFCNAIILFKERHVEPADDPERSMIVRGEPQYVVRDGVLYHIVKK